MHNKKMVDIENEGQSYVAQSHRVAIRWRISTSLKVTPEHFSQIPQFSRYSQFKIRDLINAGQGHDLQQSQWRRSMTNMLLHI